MTSTFSTAALESRLPTAPTARNLGNVWPWHLLLAEPWSHYLLPDSFLCLEADNQPIDEAPDERGPLDGPCTHQHLQQSPAKRSGVLHGEQEA